MSEKANLNVAVIGSGFGERVIVPCLNACDGLEVSAFVSRSPENTSLWSSDSGGIKFYRTVEEMLGGADVDLVCIAIPPDKHEHAVITSLVAGKHVLCEKPLSHDVESASRMLDVARNSSGHAWVDHQLRYHPCFVKIKQMIETNVIGDIFFSELSYQTATRLDAASPKWHWWFDEAQGGGQLFALGSHMIDLISWWFGKIETVQSNLLISHKERVDEYGVMQKVSADDSAFMYLGLENEIPVTVTVSSVCADEPMMTMRIVGSSGTIDFDWNSGLSVFTVSDGRKNINFDDEYIGKPVIGENVWRTSLVRQAVDIRNCIQFDAVTSCATFDDAFATQRVMEAAKESNLSKKQVQILT